MEDHNDDYYRRQDVLSLAVQLFQGRPFASVEAVTEVAQGFLNWINEVEVQ